MAPGTCGRSDRTHWVAPYVSAIMHVAFVGAGFRQQLPHAPAVAAAQRGILVIVVCGGIRFHFQLSCNAHDSNHLFGPSLDAVDMTVGGVCFSFNVPSGAVPQPMLLCRLIATRCSIRRSVPCEAFCNFVKIVHISSYSFPVDDQHLKILSGVSTVSRQPMRGDAG